MGKILTFNPAIRAQSLLSKALNFILLSVLSHTVFTKQTETQK